MCRTTHQEQIDLRRFRGIDLGDESSLGVEPLGAERGCDRLSNRCRIAVHRLVDDQSSHDTPPRSIVLTSAWRSYPPTPSARRPILGRRTTEPSGSTCLCTSYLAPDLERRHAR